MYETDKDKAFDCLNSKYSWTTLSDSHLTSQLNSSLTISETDLKGGFLVGLGLCTIEAAVAIRPTGLSLDDLLIRYF